MFFQTKTNAQDLTLNAKPRQADVKNLSGIDSLQIYSQLKTPNKKTTVGQPELPYPIIFIHGLNSNSNVWLDMVQYLFNNSLRYGGRIDFCLNDDNDNYTSNKLVYPTKGADIAYYTDYIKDLSVADFYLLNFDVNNLGEPFTSDDLIPFNDVLSNEAAIAKQGVALNIAIQMVLQKTRKDKVIIMGHSMGGLCAREYIQNPSIWTELNVNHHIAKLVTTGTPHGGYTGTNAGLVTGIDSSSEAYRDLRKEYTLSESVGAYLYGGIENQTNIDNSAFSDFYNVDVNCNGISGDNSMIVGLNQKNLPLTLDYAYIMGKCDNCLALQGTIEGDGIVRSVNANLNNFYTLPIPINEFTHQANASNPLIGLHSDLPKAIKVNMQGLDEPNELYLGYGVEYNKNYKGFIYTQPKNGNSVDFDDYKFSVTNSNQVNILINNISHPNLKARIFNIDGVQIGSEFIGNTSTPINIQKSLPLGDYFLEIFAVAPTSLETIYPYTFTLTSTTLATENFEIAETLIIFPNPTSSKVFFDNSIEKFETATVINYLGQVVLETRFNSFEANQEVDLSSFSSGVYIVKFANGDKSITKKVIKQ